MAPQGDCSTECALRADKKVQQNKDTLQPDPQEREFTSSKPRGATAQLATGSQTLCFIVGFQIEPGLAMFHKPYHLPRKQKTQNARTVVLELHCYLDYVKSGRGRAHNLEEKFWGCLKEKKLNEHTTSEVLPSRHGTHLQIR